MTDNPKSVCIAFYSASKVDVPAKVLPGPARAGRKRLSEQHVIQVGIMLTNGAVHLVFKNNLVTMLDPSTHIPQTCVQEMERRKTSKSF